MMGVLPVDSKGHHKNLFSADADLNLSDVNWSTVSVKSDFESYNFLPPWYGFLLNFSYFFKSHLFFLHFSA